VVGRARWAAFVALTGGWLWPVGCASVEAEGTNWSCTSDADCSEGNLCSRGFAPDGDQVVSGARRCVAAAQAPIVLGISSLDVEPTWLPAVEGCVQRVNSRVDQGNLVGGHPLRLRSQPYDLAAFGTGGPRDQLAQFFALVDAPDAASPRGPNSVDALYGFLQLHPDVVPQLGAVSGKDIVLFGANDGDPRYRQSPPENLFFWRPSVADEMLSLVDSIFASGVTDPKSLYVTRWSAVSVDVFDALLFAWNNSKARPALAPTVVDASDFGGVEVHEFMAPAGGGASYLDLVLEQQRVGMLTAYAEAGLDVFLSQPGPLAIVALDGPADVAGFLLGLDHRFKGTQPVSTTALDPAILGRLRLYLSSSASQMGSVFALGGGVPAAVLQKVRLSAANPDPAGATGLAQAYQRDVLPEKRSPMGFEAYIGCVYYVEALRETVRRHGVVDSASLREVLSNFSADVGLGPMPISSAKNSASSTIYLYEFPGGDPFAPRQRATWSREEGLR
jgi:hypothetical protein